MGFRYRKSINLGGGFRVNLSKSGIGYSWGTKGYRITKKAGGGIRKTYSIPGTGLSWTKDYGKGKRTSGRNANNQPKAHNISTPHYQVQNSDVKQHATENTQTYLAATKKYSRIKMTFIAICTISALLSISTPLFLIVLVAGIVGIIYTKQFETALYTMIGEIGQARSISTANAMNDRTTDYNNSSNDIEEDLHTFYDNKKKRELTENTVDFSLSDANDEEQQIIKLFLSKLDDNNLASKDCKIKKSKNGVIELVYKGTSIGKINLTFPNSWIEYQIGNNGKVKRIDGTAEELAEKTSNWLRYIINYM